MAYIPYLSVANLVDDSSGVDLTERTAPELSGIVSRASVMVDAYCKTTFQYRTIVNETHDWPGGGPYATRPVYSGEIFPDGGPIRLVTACSIEVSVNPTTGAPTSATIDVSPVPTVGGTPPHSAGVVWWDRGRGFISPLSIILRYGIFAAVPSLGLRPPQVSVSYSCGYDPADGSAPPDGYSLLLPAEVIQATHVCAVFLAAQVTLNSRGLQGLDFARDDSAYIKRAVSTRSSGMPRIPDEAADLLSRYRQQAIA